MTLWGDQGGEGDGCGKRGEASKKKEEHQRKRGKFSLMELFELWVSIINTLIIL